MFCPEAAVRTRLGLAKNSSHIAKIRASRTTPLQVHHSNRQNGQYVDALILNQCVPANYNLTESKNSSQHNQSKKAHRNGLVRLYFFTATITVTAIAHKDREGSN